MSYIYNRSRNTTSILKIHFSVWTRLTLAIFRKVWDVLHLSYCFFCTHLCSRTVTGSWNSELLSLASLPVLESVFKLFFNSGLKLKHIGQDPLFFYFTLGTSTCKVLCRQMCGVLPLQQCLQCFQDLENKQRRKQQNHWTYYRPTVTWKSRSELHCWKSTCRGFKNIQRNVRLSKKQFFLLTSMCPLNAACTDNGMCNIQI